MIFQPIPDLPQYISDEEGSIYRQYNNGKLRKLSQRPDKDGYITQNLEIALLVYNYYGSPRFTVKGGNYYCRGSMDYCKKG